jgi:hypothetical protein
MSSTVIVSCVLIYRRRNCMDVICADLVSAFHFCSSQEPHLLDHELSVLWLHTALHERVVP